MPTDPFQMAMIHLTFRNEFGHIAGLVRAAAARDTKRSSFIGSYCDNMISVLHHHHAAEDEVLWPRLQARTTKSVAVEQMKGEHVRIDGLIDKVQAARPEWQDSADRASAEKFADALDELCAGMGEHFDHEEHDVVPLIAEHVTAREWQTFIDRGAAYVNPTNLWFALAYAGFLPRDGTADEQRWFIGAVPLPLRVTLKLLGGPALASYEKKLG